MKTEETVKKEPFSSNQLIFIIFYPDFQPWYENVTGTHPSVKNLIWVYLLNQYLVG